MNVRPYLYPLLIFNFLGATGNYTAFVRVPSNSRFIWTHTVNGSGSIFGNIIHVNLFDSAKGPVTNAPINIVNFTGQPGRPFPLPEAYVFSAGSVITATYINTSVPVASTTMGIVLCGMREIIG